MNVELIEEQAKAFKIGPQTATLFHKNLFTMTPETAPFFDAEDLDPDSLHKSRKFIAIGAGIIRSILGLPTEFREKTNWAGTVKTLIEIHKENNVSLDMFKKSGPAIVKMFEDNGGCSEEQKKAWMALLDEVYKSMTEFGFS